MYEGVYVISVDIVRLRSAVPFRINVYNSLIFKLLIFFYRSSYASKKLELMSVRTATSIPIETH